MNSVFSRSTDSFDGEHHVGVGRVEHLQPQPAGDLAEGAADHLGAERGAPHPEQHGVGEPLGAALLGERVQLGGVLEHRLGDGQPAEPVLDLRHAGAAPQRRVPAPDPLRDVVLTRPA